MGDLELTSGATLGGFIALVVICLGVIYLFRNFFKKSAGSNLTEKYKDHEWSSPMEARAKYPEVNAFAWSRPIFLMGMAMAVAATLFAFAAFGLFLVRILKKQTRSKQAWLSFSYQFPFCFFIIGCIIRRDEVVIPMGSTVIEKDDEVLVLCRKEHTGWVSKLF